MLLNKLFIYAKKRMSFNQNQGMICFMIDSYSDKLSKKMILRQKLFVDNIIFKAPANLHCQIHCQTILQPACIVLELFNCTHIFVNKVFNYQKICLMIKKI